MTRRVVITGLGAVTPVGNDVKSTWESLVAGRSGVGAITTFDASSYPVRIGGMVKDFDPAASIPDPRMARYLSRAGGFGMAATAEALSSAGVTPETYEPHERGISMGSSVGRPKIEELADILFVMNSSGGHEYAPQAPSAVIGRDQNVALAAMASLGDCQGPMITVSTACTAGAHAVGEAFRRIQEGEAKLMLAGGFDSLTSWLDVLGFALLQALTTSHNDDPERASRPFDAARDGFVLAEGAVVAVLEDLEEAQKRGAPILAEVLGYGSSMNAYRITDAPPDGSGPDVAMANALRESGLAPEQIDYVSAHGTSTIGNDLCETLAIKTVFGDHAHTLAVSSPKSMTGHLTAAAGGLNLLAAVCAMRDSTVAPTVNQEHPDPKLDLDYVPNEAREMPVRAAMINAFAFGGTNAALVVRRPEPDAA